MPEKAFLKPQFSQSRLMELTAYSTARRHGIPDSAMSVNGAVPNAARPIVSSGSSGRETMGRRGSALSTSIRRFVD